MSLEKQDILQCYANRLVPNYLPNLITQNQSHFTQYSLKPEFIKANVFEIFQNIAGNNPDLSMLSKSICKLHENIKPENNSDNKDKIFFIRIGEDKQGPFDTNKVIRFLKKFKKLQNVVIENSIKNSSDTAENFLKKNSKNNFGQIDKKHESDIRNRKNKLQILDQQNFSNSQQVNHIESEKSIYLLDNTNCKNKHKQDTFNKNNFTQQQFGIFNQGQIPQQNFKLGLHTNNHTYQLDQDLDFSLFDNQNYLSNDFQNSFSDEQDIRENQVQQVIDSDNEDSQEESQQNFQIDKNHPDSLAFWMQYNKNSLKQISDTTQQEDQPNLNNDSILQEIRKMQLGKQQNKSPKKKVKQQKKEQNLLNEQIRKDSKQKKKKKRNQKNVQQDQYINQYQQGNFIIPNNTIQNLYAQQNNFSIIGQFNQQQILNPQELAQLQQNFLMSQNAMMNQPQIIKKKNKKKKNDTNKQYPNLIQSQFQNNFIPQYMSNQFYIKQDLNSLSQQQMQNYMSYLAQEQERQRQHQMFYNDQYQPFQTQMMNQNGFQAYNHDFQNSQQVKKRSKKSKKQKQQNQIFDQQQGNYENGMYPNYFQNF